MALRCGDYWSGIWYCPNCLDNSRRCLQFLADLSPDAFVSIMSQYSPQYRASDYPEINRTLTRDEYGQVMDYALDLGLENAFIQEVESQEHYLPDFALEDPFNSASSITRSSVHQLTGGE